MTPAPWAGPFRHNKYLATEVTLAALDVSVVREVEAVVGEAGVGIAPKTREGRRSQRAGALPSRGQTPATGTSWEDEPEAPVQELSNRISCWCASA
ncbi:hypothetical protein GCM10012275_58870 [Longimycelium tulufanense]|uniref:Uncharacterized protein n=1 Tax=Longimycelium tulufanense TaxID=907463 RepID=A0A8J3CJW3_9PSEU|nr:hypothetical protein GCM10012275_58870 [Longimycelium tulufanense]